LPRRLDDGFAIPLFDGHQRHALERVTLMTIKQ